MTGRRVRHLKFGVVSVAGHTHDTLPTVLSGEKTVTRRLVRPEHGGTCPFAPGDVCPVAGADGVPVGAWAEVVSVRCERLSAVLGRDDEVRAEGMPPGTTPEDLVAVVRDVYGLEDGADPDVWRVEFKLVGRVGVHERGVVGQ